MKIFLEWKDLNFVWSEIKRDNQFMTWSDIALIEEIESVFRKGGTSLYDRDAYEKWVNNNPWKQISQKVGEEKTEQFIKIFCQVNGLNFEEVKKKRNGVKVSVAQFDRVFENNKVKINIKI